MRYHWKEGDILTKSETAYPTVAQAGADGYSVVAKNDVSQQGTVVDSIGPVSIAAIDGGYTNTPIEETMSGVYKPEHFSFKQYNFTQNNIKSSIIKSEDVVQISGKKEINSTATAYQGSGISLESKRESIVNKAASEKEAVNNRSKFIFGIGKSSSSETQTSIPVTFQASGPQGYGAKAAKNITDQGTVIDSKGDVTFSAQKYVNTPAEEKKTYKSKQGNQESNFKANTFSPSVTKAVGTILYGTDDASLVGAQLIAGGVAMNHDGDFSLKAARGRVVEDSSAYKERGCWIFKSSTKVQSHNAKDVILQPQLTTDNFLMSGKGTVFLESLRGKIMKMDSTKSLKETTMMERNDAWMSEKRSGWFAPKIKMDPVFEAANGIVKSISIGDAIPNTIGLASTSVQTATHLTILKNLRKVGNPLVALGSIFLDRYVTGISFGQSESNIWRKEEKPVQSEIDVGVLQLKTDGEIRLEGNWNVKDAHIEAGKMTMKAPVHKIEERRKSSGWRVSFGAGGVLAAFLCGAPFVAALPLVSVSEESSFTQSETVKPATLTADNLFINVGNAVYSGGQIKAKALKAIARGNVTIETMTDLFKTESHRTDVGVSLAGLFSAFTNVPAPGAFLGGATALSAVPSMCFASEKVVSEKFDQAAKVVGLKDFYMKVGGLLHTKSAETGLTPDAYITSSEKEHIEAGRILNENVHTEHKEDHTVFNPCLAELLTLESQVSEFKRVQSHFMTQRLYEGESMDVVREEVKEVTPEKIQQAKALKKEQVIRRHKALEEVEKRLPKVEVGSQELRAKMLTEYMNSNKEELVGLVERSTLEEIKAEVDYFGDIPQEKRGFHETLLNCIHESDVTEQELETCTAKGIGEATKTLPHMLIPGYSAWASGGNTTEVISSAASDIVLTIVGGKVVKMAFTGGKALYRGAKTLGKEMRAASKAQIVERQLLLPSAKVADHHIFPQKYRPNFEKLGIDIDKYTVSLGQNTHLRGIHGKGSFGLAGKWNDRWKAFFQQNPDATAKDTYQFAGKLMDEYKLNKEILHGYRK
jgi:hypothetical protein